MPVEKASSDSGARELVHALSDRHILFIALGGAIGAGLFLGSSLTIRRAGPGMLLAYALSGCVIFLMARALGEMTVGEPNAGSFSAYAERYIGPWAGFISGWAYWLIWMLVGAAEITAVGVMTRYWFPQVPQWPPALAALILLYGMNLMNVRVFGELEFWLSILKVVTILVLIIVGGTMVVLHLGPADAEPSFSNLWSHGGFLPTGLQGLVTALPLALFAFGGTELIGLTAAEAKNPNSSVPRAINGVVFRVLIFYVGSLAVIVALVPWDQLGGGQSPFVLALSKIGLPAAASIVNLVALSAVLSSCNSGIFASARMLRALGYQGHAPACAAQLSKNGHPSVAVTASAVLMLGGVLLNYWVPERALEYVMQSVTTLLLFVWLVVVVCHLRYRRHRGIDVGPFRMPGYPVSNWLAIVFFGVVVVILLLDPNSRVAVTIALFMLAGLGAAFVIAQRRRRILR
jgi:AAT family amino acid transporter